MIFNSIVFNNTILIESILQIIDNITRNNNGLV